MRTKITNEKGYTQVYIDGVEVHRVASIEFKEAVDKPPTIVLELLPNEIELEVDGVSVDYKTLKTKQEEELMNGYKDFIKYLFRGKYNVEDKK